MSEERKTTEDTNICIPCGYIFVDDDDYDTLGSESGICCPDCGRENFVSVAEIIKQRDALKAACEAIVKKQADESIFRLPANCEEIKMVKSALALCQESSTSVAAKEAKT